IRSSSTPTKIGLAANAKKAHTSSEVRPKVATSGVWKKKCDALRTNRNSLFADYTKDPQNISLAREIKALDDEIADCTQHVEQERRAEQRASDSATKIVNRSNRMIPFMF